MARIAGVDLPNKATKIALTYIYGIGRTSAEEICKKCNVDPDAAINSLSAEVLAEVRHRGGACRSGMRRVFVLVPAGRLQPPEGRLFRTGAL